MSRQGSAGKADRFHDLYARAVDGVALGTNDYVISADEKSQLQALHRCHPGRPAGPGHVTQVEFEYERGGTIADKAGIVPFMELVSKVMTQERMLLRRRSTGWSTTGHHTSGNDRSNDRGVAERPPGASPPFDWRFTRSDLDAMLQRLDAQRLEPDTTLAA